MKNMQLMQLKLINFKGINYFILDAKGQNTSVFGDNATGKTTLFDAFLWLLFNKDSQGKTEFNIKTLDMFNQPKHGLDHEVEATFQVDSRTLTLKKVYKEKWTKKRGSNNKTFTGHDIKYFVNDVPSKKKEFDDTVSDMISENIFKLITSPTYFNEQITWQERRDILLDIGGDLSDQEVIEGNADLSRLTDILSGRSIDDQKKIIAAKRHEINKELELIPARIDEVTRSLPDLTSLDQEDLKRQIDHVSFAIEDKDKELSSIGNGGNLLEKIKKKQQAESDMLIIKNQINAETTEKISAQRLLLNDKWKEADGLSYKISDTESHITLNLQSIQAGEDHAQKLREEWGKANDQEFSFEDQTICSMCGRELPADQIEETKTKALEQFNLSKSKRLEQIKTQGEQEVKTINELKEKNDHYQQSITTNQAQLDNYQQDIHKIEDTIKELESLLVSAESDPQYVWKQTEIESIQKEIKQLNESTEEEEAKVRQEINQLKNDRLAFESDLALFKQSEAAQERIEELSQQERKLASEYEKLEEELSLIETFIKTKVDLLEERINSKFKYARFKLFDTLINGGISETCETLYDGVPYSGGLNNAARINVGLDIINTLSQHYSFSAPIFVDNREAVTQLTSVDSQVISLIVSEEDKTLRVATQPLQEAM